LDLVSRVVTEDSALLTLIGRDLAHCVGQLSILTVNSIPADIELTFVLKAPCFLND
jgi:hypothetical protein